METYFTDKNSTAEIYYDVKALADYSCFIGLQKLSVQIIRSRICTAKAVLSSKQSIKLGNEMSYPTKCVS